MTLKKLAGYVVIGALFGIILAWGFIPKYEPWYGFSLLGLSCVALVLWLVLSLNELTLWVKQRSAQYYMSLAITLVMTGAIAAVINWMAYTNNKKWDLTTNKLHSLSDQSKKIVSELNEKVTIRVWSHRIEAMSPNLDMRRFFDNYALASGGKVQIEIKDPNENMVEANADNVKRDNLIIVKAESGRESRIDSFNDAKGEEQLTNAIVQAVRGSKKTVCFLAGHNEFSITDTSGGGLSIVRDRLNDSSYEAKEINLLGAAKVPENCEVVVVVGPRGDASESDLKILKTYLNEGGKLMALLGPGTGAGWKSLVGEYGVELQNDLLIEPQNRPPVVIATNNFAQDVEITKNSNAIVIFLESSSLKLPTSSTFNGATVKTFISSMSSAISKTGNIKTEADLMPRSTDKHGPLPLAALVNKPLDVAAATIPTDSTKPGKPEIKKKPEKAPGATEAAPKKSGWNMPSVISKAYAEDGEDEESAPEGAPPMSIPGAPGLKAPTAKDGPKDVKKETGLLVFGSATFAANGVVPKGGNLDLFLNSISYLTKDQDLIGIRPRDLKNATLELTELSTRQVRASIFFLSAMFFFFAILSVQRKFVKT